MRKRMVAVATALPVAAVVALAGCGGSDSGGGGSEEGVVSIGIGEPQHLFTTDVGETEGHQVISALYTPLVTYGEDLNIEMAAAESVETDDNKVWTIKIRDDQKFQNGDAVTADSYINAWNYGAYGPNAQQLNSYFARIQGYEDLNPTDDSEPTTDQLSGLEKVDEHTIQVTLTDPYIDFDKSLGYTNYLPLPDAAFDDPAAFESSPIGNGPFKMKGEWQHDQLIQVEAWDDYPGDKPQINGIDFKIYQDPVAQYNDVLANNLDITKSIPTEQIANAEQDLGDRFQQSPSGSFQGIGFPDYDEKYSDVRVRHAISMAIDRAEITEAIFDNSQDPAMSWVSPQIPGATADTCGQWCQFDPDQAKELWDEAGGVEGNSIQISYNTDGGHQEWVEATCNQLKTNLEVDCIANPMPKFADMLTDLANQAELGMFRLGWIPDYPSMDSYLQAQFSCDAIPAPNYTNYCDEEFDNLLDEAYRADTQEEAQAKYLEAEKLLPESMPMLPLRFGKNNFGHSENVSGVSIDVFYELDLMSLKKN
ncbi:peptide/nickel transport system substrate-binding protein/oligopeptide transport system substrate-binding protein [Stackebrandtia endophytica]|uniref:Peptide/nickel transport system substrate-binding protein/oligopeptide transport system substrate-binding protein n=1 Tax=Stackebrandtia endophytica TaxID=1496996 RepID=A0A543AV57_9ACTN|nr:ABC transporter substrate-binding protein [Stackebrandtia endophytica]TQL76437.1 peptide/nickel transport system substrate-binding protein/oligopeptide transport system substrate-binding protein [Stackebrandtia endophytica]